MTREGIILNTDGKKVGLYKILWGNLCVKKVGRYNYEKCYPVNNTKFYDQHQRITRTVREEFNNNVVLICEPHQALYEVQEDDDQWTVIEHEYAKHGVGHVHGMDLSTIIFNLKNAQNQNLTA